jgi:hypothetical protein
MLSAPAGASVPSMRTVEEATISSCGTRIPQPAMVMASADNDAHIRQHLPTGS